MHELESTAARWQRAAATLPLMAILRGVKPGEVLGIAEVLVEAGFRLIEVPLNSPEPLRSIELLARHADADTLVGAGTVLEPAQVTAVAEAGGRLVVMPHADLEVVRAARSAGMVCLPGVATPTEAFGALAAGADGLKLFPAEASSPKVLKAMLAVLPPATRVFPVGGITADGMRPWLDAGAAGFGLGSALYRSGDGPAEVAAAARRFVDAWAGFAWPGTAGVRT
jgi:2-dehydro-3-deoxyphosphogalactonate aldolase